MRRRTCGILAAALCTVLFVVAQPVLANRPASGIAGHVVAGPTCPVETVPPQPGCAPRPLAASVRITRVGRPARHWVVHSNSAGRFRIRLVPGTYRLQPLQRGDSPYPRPPAASRARVVSGRFTTVTITYDTGIR